MDRRPWGLALAALCLCSRVDAQAPNPGDLDVSFGGTGIVTHGDSQHGELATDIAVDGEGRLLIAAVQADYLNGISAGFVVLRYRPDGQLDETWGEQGVVATPIDALNVIERAEALVVQPDGRIVVAGYTERVIGKFVVLRYLADGTLDTAFGGSGTGIVTTDLGASAFAHAVALQADGKIVVAGFIERAATGADLCVVRYYANGARDLDFGTDGMFAPTINGDQVARGVAMSGGRIVLAGDSESVGPRTFLVARLNANGSPDLDFGDFGLTVTGFGTGGAGATALALQPNGRTVVVGDSASSGQSADVALARYSGSGLLDGSFDGDGKRIVPLSAGFDRAMDVRVQLNGKIVIAGVSQNDAALMRFHADGSSDTGVVLTSPGPLGGGFEALTLQPDGKIVAAGGARMDLYNGDLAVVRYHGDVVDLIFADGFDGP